MNGIDVSNWQKGINLKNVPADFVIVKATEGNYYISEDYDRQANQTKEAGKLLGLYHYANGGNAEEEANFFLNNIKEHIGNAILVLDWEGQNNPLFGVKDLEWCKKWCDHIRNKTGVKPFIYIQQSAMAKINGVGDYPLWVAQYPNYEKTGYQSAPWNEGAYTCAIRQYTSSGRLEGFNGDLDLNKAYMDKATWLKHAGKNVEEVKVSGSTLYLVVATIEGQFGNGEDRKKRLGNRYNEVQDLINHIATANIDQLVKETKEGKYGNGETRKIILGSRYNDVQNRINNVPSVVNYTIKAGDTLSGIAAKYDTTYQKIVSLNGITNPDRIYPGQTIRVK